MSPPTLLAASLVPVAMLEAEGVYRPHEAEGETGFEVRRALAGVRWSLAPWAEVVTTINAVAVKPVPLLWDAHVVFSHRSGAWVAGFGQTPLFPSVQQPRDTNPIPELSLLTAAFWPGRRRGWVAGWRGLRQAQSSALSRQQHCRCCERHLGSAEACQ